MEELQGEGWIKGIQPGDAGRMTDAWMSSVLTGAPFHFEFRGFRARDETYRWCVSSRLAVCEVRGLSSVALVGDRAYLLLNWVCQ